MAVIHDTLRAAPEQVWALVTDLGRWDWRSDLSRIEPTEGGFIEYTKSGYPTAFTITEFDPPRRYAFSMENGNLTGRWAGRFSPHPSGGTSVEFTEEIFPKKALMKLAAGFYLKRQQKQYLMDLKRALGE